MIVREGGGVTRGREGRGRRGRERGGEGEGEGGGGGGGGGWEGTCRGTIYVKANLVKHG